MTVGAGIAETRTSDRRATGLGPVRGRSETDLARPPLVIVTDGLGHGIGPMPEPVARRIVARNRAKGRTLKVVKWA